MKGRMLVAIMAMLGMAAHADDTTYSNGNPPATNPGGDVLVDNMYVGVGVLQNSLETSDVNTGFGGAVQLGWLVDGHLSLEGDYRYRQNDYHVYSGTATRHSGTAVVQYAFTDNDLWRPYVAGGLGFEKSKQVFHYGTDPEGTVAIGLLYFIDKTWTIRAEITHMRIFSGGDTAGTNENMALIGFEYSVPFTMPKERK